MSDPAKEFLSNPKIDITLVVDRSGSMAGTLDDTHGGLNTFLKEQQDVDGDATLTFIQFDNEYEIVHDGVDIHDVEEIRITPRGTTALLDAVCTAINTAKHRINELPDDEKPDQVVFVIITDGGENASREYNLEQCKALIEEHNDEWQFVFMGADINEFGAFGGGVGIAAGSAMSFSSHDPSAVAHSYATLSRSMTSYRMDETLRSAEGPKSVASFFVGDGETSEKSEEAS